MTREMQQQMAGNDDTWDPFNDPDGESALKGLGDRLTPNEWRILRGLADGQRLREIEIDRLVSLGLARRDLYTADPQLTALGRDALQAARDTP